MPNDPQVAESPVSFDFDDLPVEVFELVASGLTLGSLTAGHGLTETGASVGCDGGCLTSSCCGSCGPPVAE
jgi:Thiopeptide-type bacteriocin precursor